MATATNPPFKTSSNERKSETSSNSPRFEYSPGSIVTPPLDLWILWRLHGQPAPHGDRWLPHPLAAAVPLRPSSAGPSTPGAHNTPPHPGPSWVSRSLAPRAPCRRHAPTRSACPLHARPPPAGFDRPASGLHPPPARHRRPAPPGSPVRHPPARKHPTRHHDSRPHGSARPPGRSSPPTGTTRSGRPAPATPLQSDPPVRLPPVRLRLSTPACMALASPVCIRQMHWPRNHPPVLRATSHQHEPHARSPPDRTTPDMSTQLPQVRLPTVRSLSIRHPAGRDMPALPWAHQWDQVGLRWIPTHQWNPCVRLAHISDIELAYDVPHMFA